MRLSDSVVLYRLTLGKAKRDGTDGLFIVIGRTITCASGKLVRRMFRPESFAQ